MRVSYSREDWPYCGIAREGASMSLVSSLLRPAGKLFRDIQVSGLTNFSESRWREAILYYLFGIWGNRSDVTYRPKISFGDIWLRLHSSNGRYYAYGHEEIFEPVPALGNDDLVETSDEQARVEVALIRFVKNDKIKQLRLRFPSVSNDTCVLVLWKKTRRGEYGVASLGLPYSWCSDGPLWTRKEAEAYYRP